MKGHVLHFSTFNQHNHLHKIRHVTLWPRNLKQTFPVLMSLKRRQWSHFSSLPYQVAAEEQAEDEDEYSRPKHNNVNIEGKVLEPYVWHPESMVLEIGTHG